MLGYVALLRVLLGESSRPVLCEPDRCPRGGRLLEHHVDLLEVPAHGLGIKEEYRQRYASRDGGEDDVVLPADRRQRNRGHWFTGSAIDSPDTTKRVHRQFLPSATTKFHSQWLAVEMEDMAILSLMGAISVQYKKLAPRKPMGTKVLYR